jgi:hypothetical protein
MRQHERKRVTESRRATDYVTLHVAGIGDLVCRVGAGDLRQHGCGLAERFAISPRSASLTAAAGSVSISSITPRRRAASKWNGFCLPHDAFDRVRV